MTPPRRLIDEIEQLSAPEKRALEAGRGDRPRAEFVDGVFTSLLAKIPPLVPGGDGGASSSIGSNATGAAGGTSAAAGATGAASGAAGATGAAGSLGGAFGVAGAAGAVKAAVLGAAIGALVLTGRAALAPAPVPDAPAGRASVELTSTGGADDHARTPTVERAGQALEPNRGRVEAAEPPAREPTLPPPVAAVAKASEGGGAEPRASAYGRPPREPSGALASAAGDVPPIAPPAADDPMQETRLVGAAREALRRTDWRVASELLEQAGQRFPRGILLQEREALAIETLVQSGQRALAGERAQAFFRAYPASPHAARVRAIVAAP